MRRLLGAVVFVATLVSPVAVAAPAGADAPGPTDYRSEVIAIEPDDGVVSFGFIGGDDIIEMTVVPGHEVMVTGYRGEPYLWIREDGTVLENQRSPSTYLNQDRYGEGDLPDRADVDAEPDWREIGGGGQVAWHDHRSHWMSRDRPMGSGPGDQILEAVIPLTIDGEPVLVSVGAWWDEPPPLLASFAPIVLGAVVAVWVVRRRDRAGIVGAVTSLVALVLGGVAFFSVPGWTSPDPLLWLLPLLALFATVVILALAQGDQSETSDSTGDWLLLCSGILLGWWAISRDDALRLPILSTDAPWWLDRTAIGATIPIAVALCVVGVQGRYRSLRHRRTAPVAPA